MTLASLCSGLSSLSLQDRRPQQAPAARSAAVQLSSRRNGICSAALRPLEAPGSSSSRACGASQLTVECKLKTRKAAAKRFKVTGSGKVVCRHAGKQHINEKKTRSRLRHLSSERTLEKADRDNVRSCLPYAKIK